jgi:hypothetical protein
MYGFDALVVVVVVEKKKEGWQTCEVSVCPGVYTLLRQYFQSRLKAAAINSRDYAIFLIPL